MSSLLATVLIQLLGIFTGVLLARVLGPAGRGELAAVLLWPMLLVALGNLGITDSITYSVVRGIASLRAILGTSMALAAMQTALLLGLGLILIPVVLADYEPAVLGAGLLFLSVIPLGLLGLHMIAMLNGMLRFAAFNALRVAVIALAAVGLAGLAASGRLTVPTAAWAYLVAQLITMLLGLVLVLRATRGLGRPSPRLARSMLAYGGRSQLSTGANMLNERAGPLAISILLAPVDLGLYVAAWSLTSFVSLVGYSVAYAALPAVAGIDNAAGRRAALRRYTVVTLSASLLMATPLLIFAPVVLELAFGAAFRDVTSVARVLLGASVLLAIGSVLTASLKAMNRPLDAARADGLGLLVTIVGLVTLIPALGTMGAAVTCVIAYLTATALALDRANRALNAPVSRA